MKIILRLEDGVSRAERTALVVLLIFMVGLSFLQVVMRAFFSSSLIWADPLLRHAVLWAGLLGAVLASRAGRQFALDAILKFFPVKLQKVCELAARVFTLFVCVLLFYASAKFLKDEFGSQTVAFSLGRAGIRAAWLELIVPGAFLLIFFHTSLDVFREKTP